MEYESMTVFPFFALSLALLVTQAVTAAPNILVILTDDQGWGDLSLNGNIDLSTPNIDSLATDGARFDRFYVCPVCSPTRAEFLTGRYHPHSGVYSTSAGGERMNLEQTTIADVFKNAGYRTGAFGKWHNGMQYPYHPNGRGFEEFYGFCSGHWGNYFSPPLDHNGRIVKGEGFCIDDFTDKAIDFMAASSEQPFFAYLPYNTPHSPMQIPDRWWDKFKDKELSMSHPEARPHDLDHTRAALAMCENIDWNVGRLLKKLDELKIANDTIVVYFCDNGPNGRRWNGEMKGQKGSTDEGGVRSPLLIRWPSNIPKGSIISNNGAAIDLLPTLAGLAAIKPATYAPLDGVDLSNLLLQKQPHSRKADVMRTIFSHWRGKVSARYQHYRLDHRGKLYDTSEDPSQLTDISESKATLANRLRGEVIAWRKDVLDGHDNDKRPFLIGHSRYLYTQIPARDGTAHGNIKRSNKFPNCSFFSNWTSVDDKITWEALVATSGDYDVELHYTCPQESVGSTIQLSFNDNKITSKITEAHDSPLIGAEHDRVKRQESYIKEFKTMSLGRMHLKQGKGTLTLQATHIPGAEAMAFRLLMLTRANS